MTHNVTCWLAVGQMQQAAVGPAGKDKAFFVLEPSRGVLLPGERSIVRVVFTPTDTRAYATKLPIKVTGNPKARAVAVRGRGSVMSLSFDPPRAQAGPLLPLAPPVAVSVRLVNPCAVPLEVYSLDFDGTYVEEEEVLRRSELYGDDGLLRYPPRLPSEPLPSFILEADREALAAAAAAGTCGRDYCAVNLSTTVHTVELPPCVIEQKREAKAVQASVSLSDWVQTSRPRTRLAPWVRR
jgi:hypothetical protein